MTGLRKYVEPLARELDAAIVMPTNVQQAGQVEAVFARIAKEWGRLDFLVHSIASAPKETLRGRAVDASRVSTSALTNRRLPRPRS